MVNPLLEAALRYADMGYPVFPCSPAWKTPLTLHGHLDASVDPEQIEEWWKTFPNANIGISTTGLLVIDIDGADNPWNPELPCSPVSLTPRGGRHLIYRQPEGASLRNSAGKLALRVDIRGDGGYVVVPPSIINGIPYRWAPTCELVPPNQLTVVPEWIVTLLAEPTQEPQPLENIIQEGERNDTLTRIAGLNRRHGMSEPEILALIAKINENRCRPPLQKREVKKIAWSIARYEPDQIATATIENHWGQDAETPEERTPDPGPLPEYLLRIPGFVSEVLDHCMAIAPYPNQVMALCGAIALQAVLAGRKVRDDSDNRTNLYLLALAHSASGKDAPRKLNTEILHAVGMEKQVGGWIASGEGLQDMLYINPCILMQPDEIDGLLRSVNLSKDARYEGLMDTLLTLYSSSNSIVPMRAKAGKDTGGTINQPNLVLLGTAIPNHYYEALSERMLTNGFFARMIVFECHKRGPGQMPTVMNLPPRILDTAGYWANYKPTKGNLQNQNPRPGTVPRTPDAERMLQEIMAEAGEKYAEAEGKNDPMATTVWGRATENTMKLSLIYAISAKPTDPSINKAAVQWAREVVFHQIDRMLFMAKNYVSVNPHDKECQKVVRILREAGGKIGHSELMRKLKVDVKTLNSVLATLQQRGRVSSPRMGKTATNKGRFYELIGK